MKPEQLQLWQPQASTEQLRQFIEENPSLFMLMDEAWRKFQQTHAALFVQNMPPARLYAEHMSLDQLEHHPISEAELAEFLQLFDQKKRKTDRPFGDNPNIQDQDWSLSDD